MKQIILTGLAGLVLLAACEPAEAPATASQNAPAAAPTIPAAPSGVPVAGPELQGWVGRYTLIKDNGMVDGDSFKSTDTLDIVATGADQVFLRADLLFFNGHTCAISGLAKLEGEALVLRGTEKGLYPGCVLTLKRGGDQLLFEDPGAMCTMSSCGVRGSYVDYAMPLATRAPIDEANLAEILASTEYRVATGAEPGEGQ